MWTYKVVITLIMSYCIIGVSVTDSVDTNVILKTNNDEIDNLQNLNLTTVSTLPGIVERINSIVNQSTGGDWVKVIDDLIKKITDRLQSGSASNQQIVLTDFNSPPVNDEYIASSQETKITYRDVDDPTRDENYRRHPHTLRGHGQDDRNPHGMANAAHSNRDYHENELINPNHTQISNHRRSFIHKLMATLHQTGKSHLEAMTLNGSTGNATFLDKLMNGTDELVHGSLQILHPIKSLFGIMRDGKGDNSGHKLPMLAHEQGTHGKIAPGHHGNGTDTAQRNPHIVHGKDRPHRKHRIDIDKLTPIQLHSLLEYLRQLKESNGRATFRPKLHELCCIVG